MLAVRYRVRMMKARGNISRACNQVNIDKNESLFGYDPFEKKNVADISIGDKTIIEVR